MGWKDWVYGDLVSAADFQSLVQDQTVQRYASSSARSAALGSAVAEGMVSYLDSTNQVEVYDGSSWTSISSAGSGNAVINGAFDIWQRSTSFTMPNTDTQYGAADRWLYWHNGSTAGTNVISRQTHTRGQTLVPGNPTYFQRWTSTTLGSGQTISDFQTKIEDVGTFAGQTVTLSFYSASSTAGKTIDVYFTQIFGSGGSTAVDTTVTTAATLTTGFARYTVTVTLPSISGKTVGAGDNLRIILRLNGPTAGMTWDLSNVQLEAGSSATSFKRNAPSIQGELAACQRYYWRNTRSGAFNAIGGNGFTYSSTNGYVQIAPPVPMRTTPTSIDFSSIRIADQANAAFNISAVALTGEGADANASAFTLGVTVSGATSGRYFYLQTSGSNGYLGLSAEL